MKIAFVGLGVMGFPMAGHLARAGHELPMLNAVLIPEGVNDAAVRGELLRRFGIEIGGGLGDFRGRAWRIGLMGYSARRNNVLLLLAALEQLLAEQGTRFPRGASVAAANDVYAASR